MVLGRVLGWIGVVALAAGAAGCTSSVSDVFSGDSGLFSQRPRFFSNARQVQAVERRTRALGPEDYLSADGQCAAVAGEVDANGNPVPMGAGSGGVALEMSECDAVRALGQPDSFAFGEGPERRLTLTYRHGPRPGIYQFRDGRLATMERGEEPPPERPQPTKKRRARG